MRTESPDFPPRTGSRLLPTRSTGGPGLVPFCTAFPEATRRYGAPKLARFSAQNGSFRRARGSWRRLREALRNHPDSATLKAGLQRLKTAVFSRVQGSLFWLKHSDSCRILSHFHGRNAAMSGFRRPENSAIFCHFSRLLGRPGCASSDAGKARYGQMQYPLQWLLVNGRPHDAHSGSMSTAATRGAARGLAGCVFSGAKTGCAVQPVSFGRPAGARESLVLSVSAS